jgi:tetratricopeptide (TPR) repeat protein
MGEAYFVLSEYIAAIECYHKALELNPEYENLFDIGEKTPSEREL